MKQFVAANECIAEFLRKYESDGVSWGEKAMGLARFFRWLKVVKGLELSPTEFLNVHLEKRQGRTIEERRWALKLALEYSRDNSDPRDKASNYVYGAFFLPVKMFCDYHEAPLTSTNGFFPKCGRRKYAENPFTVDAVKRVLSVLSQRDRAICMVELQSGQSIHQVLVDINKQCKRIFREIDSGKERIRLDFPERKGNNFPYFTFISKDAIQEIQKWRPKRQEILKSLNMDSESLFITDTGKPLPCIHFHNSFRLTLMRNKLYTGPFSVRSHGFRKFFEQEASHPERGISKSYVTFMMGHSNGNGEQHKLDIVGGVYDAAPKVYPDAVEKEYAKLEPFINIYTGRPAENDLGISDEDVETLKELLQKMKEGKVKIES
jgi:integrase